MFFRDFDVVEQSFFIPGKGCGHVSADYFSAIKSVVAIAEISKEKSSLLSTAD